MEKEIEIKVYGRVQGVNFRGMAKKKAILLGLKGIVMNRDDGSIEIIAKGPKEKILEIINWIQRSPGFSSVKGMSYNWRESTREFDGFKVVKNNSLIVDKAKSLLMLGRSFFKKRKLVFPAHIIIIPDGNRRWARKRGLEASEGHYTSASFQHIRELFNEARRLGIKYMSLWGFSTENWKRDKKEIDAIFKLIRKSVEEFREEAHTNKIRFRHLGRKDRLPEDLLQEIKKLEEETEMYREFNVQLCLDYGGRDEILRAVNMIIKDREKEVNEEEFERYLDTYGIPDPDMVIRTSGEQRTSGFMPYQAAYAELYFSNKHFPDFNAKELREAVEEYGRRQRRFGGG